MRLTNEQFAAMTGGVCDTAPETAQERQGWCQWSAQWTAPVPAADPVPAVKEWVPARVKRILTRSLTVPPGKDAISVTNALRAVPYCRSILAAWFASHPTANRPVVEADCFRLVRTLAGSDFPEVGRTIG